MAREILELARLREMIRSGRARELRLGAGLTLRAIGDEVGAAPSNVLRWEKGRMPRGDSALRYARLLRELEVLEGLSR